jgi:nitroimidazol reductase NimA-like FMN-containing flavoprotein (pyridoxamine 5'-phosphate oxidase superfamily)
MNEAKAREIIARNRYCVLSTASRDGRPWVAPVFFNCDASFRLFWESDRQALHSQLIAANPRVAVVVADLEPDGPNEALYFDCSAREVPAERLAEAVESYKGGPHTKPECRGRTATDYMGASPLRLYEAVPEAIYARVFYQPGGGYPVERRVKLDVI